jgi:NADH-quinone oxidoreductase subunit G
LSEVAAGRDTHGIAAALSAGELTALYLLDLDPLHDLPDRPLWEEALDHASSVIAHASFLTDGIREHATVVFPAEAAAEKEGTVTHPDGRLQRLRPAIARQGEVRAGWSVIAELCARLGADTGIRGGVAASEAVFEAVGIYDVVALEEIGGRGVQPGGEVPAPGAPVPVIEPAPMPAPRDGALRLSSYRPVWAAPEVAASPALAFLHPQQRVEISPADARARGLADGVEMLVVDDSGAGVRARVAVRDAVTDGRAILLDGIPHDSANRLRGELVWIVPIPEPPPPEEELEAEEAMV